jgi:hypothetical protein
MPFSVLTHLHFLSCFSRSDFQNPISCIACCLGLPFKAKNSEIQYRTRELWDFPYKGSHPSWSLRHFWYLLSFSVVSLAMSLKMETFLCHWIACSLALRLKPKNSKIWYRSRELWGFSGEGSRPTWSPPQFWPSLTFLAVSLVLSFKIQSFLLHCRVCPFTLQFKLENLEIRYRTRELWAFSGEGAPVDVFLSFYTSSLFQSFLSPWVVQWNHFSAIT